MHDDAHLIESCSLLEDRQKLVVDLLRIGYNCCTVGCTINPQQIDRQLVATKLQSVFVVLSRLLLCLQTIVRVSYCACGRHGRPHTSANNDKRSGELLSHANPITSDAQNES